MPIKVAPSIMAADQARLGEELKAVEEAGADIIHLDVMDGVFVPNLTFGYEVVAYIRKYSSLPFDAHLMLINPLKYIASFVSAGVNRISIHVESTNVSRSLLEIRRLGALAGIAINPDTPVEAVEPFIPLADFLVVMTVFPGFYGQKMIVEALDKVRILRDKQIALGKEPFIQVDGGVSPSNIHLVRSYGPTEVVAGAAVFKAEDYKEAIRGLKYG